MIVLGISVLLNVVLTMRLIAEKKAHEKSKTQIRFWRLKHWD